MERNTRKKHYAIELIANQPKIKAKSLVRTAGQAFPELDEDKLKNYFYTVKPKDNLTAGDLYENLESKMKQFTKLFHF